jgi:hypothetical protein
MTWQPQHAFFIARRRRPLNFFYDYFIASTKFEGTSEYDNIEIVFFTAVLLLSISFNLWDKTGTGSLDEVMHDLMVEHLVSNYHVPSACLKVR